MRPTHHSDEEIKIINATVDIGVLAEALGFVLDRGKSAITSKKYVRGSDRIVVKDSPRYPGQEYMTLGKSKEEGDCGPAFNFVYHREGQQNLGKTRQILRPFIGTLDGAAAAPMPVPTWTADEDPDRQDEWEALSETPLIIKKHVVNHLYSMGLTRETLKTFQGLIYADTRKNACFVSRQHTGKIVGWSLRGTQNIKWRSSYGRKALFFGPAGKKKTEHLVVCESALDALSYWQLLHSEVDIAVAATNGNAEYIPVVLLARALDAKQVIVATDNDAAGEEQGKALTAVLDDAGVPWFYHRPPTEEKDWNRYLLAQLGRAA